MKVLITNEDSSRYSVQNYKYKVLQSSLPDLPPVPQGVQRATLKELPDSPGTEKKASLPKEEEDEEKDFISNELHNSIVDSLLKKADEFSEKFLKAEMQYEDLLESTNKREDEIRKSSYEEGLAAGLKQAQEASGREQAAMLIQMQDAVRLISGESEKFSTALKSVNEELVGAALDIAKEVIVKELSEASNAIAISLARQLIQEIDKEGKIRLKVNPANFEALQLAVTSNSNITVESDNAVQVGGVIIISKIETIEADIMRRYEQIKRTALNS